MTSRNLLLALRRCLAVALCALLSPAFADAPAPASGDPTPTIAIGARAYYERCTLCHGDDGLGEGLLPLSVPGYPPTGLLDPAPGTDAAAVRRDIVWGGALGEMHEYSPPWGDELTWTEIESLVLFVSLMRDDYEAAMKELGVHGRSSTPSVKIGRGLFQTRCALCHGRTGEGDGKMARVIKDPPPFNLTESVMPDAYLTRIISDGGAALGRSPQMPPWGGELSASELQSVLLYIKTLRH